MKKFLPILLIFVLVIVGGPAIFIATFNADRYRPLLVSQLAEAMHRPVKLERLAVGWRHGVAIQLRGLSMLETGEPAREPLMTVESFDAVVRLWPLLHRNIQVTSVVIRRPQVHAMRDVNGRINVLGLAETAGPAAASGRRSPTGASVGRLPAGRPGSPEPVEGSTTIGNTAIALDVDSVRLEDGTLHWTDAMVKPPIEAWVRRIDVQLRHIVPGQPMQADLRAAVGTDAQNLRVSGALTLPSTAVPGAVEHGVLALERLSLEQLAPPGPPGQPRLSGVVSATVQGRAPTLDPARAMHALSATGRLQATDVKIANMNLLRVVFERFTMLPGLIDLLEAQLPPVYQRKLAATDTAFAPLDIPFRVEQGALQFDRLQLRSDAFELAGAGRIGLDRSIAIRATLRVDAELSAAFMKSVKELRGLFNADGQLEIPLTIQERPPYVLPDLNDVGSRLLTTTVQDLLGNFLQKAIPQGQSSQPASPSQ